MKQSSEREKDGEVDNRLDESGVGAENSSKISRIEPLNQQSKVGRAVSARRYPPQSWRRVEDNAPYLRQGHGMGTPRTWPLPYWLGLVVILSAGAAMGQELRTLLLPPPQTEGGKPLMQALRQRRTVREFRSDRLPVPVLGNLLWAAFGVNRPETGGRTAPSAMNSQEVDVYVALRDGLYLYEPKPHQLKLVATGDVRGKTGGQGFATNAPVTLLFVADHARLSKAKPEGRAFYADVDTGYISQNVYLFCASEGLGTVVHDLDRAPLVKVLSLRPDQRIILAQAVGYPKE